MSGWRSTVERSTVDGNMSAAKEDTVAPGTSATLATTKANLVTTSAPKLRFRGAVKKTTLGIQLSGHYRSLRVAQQVNSGLCPIVTPPI